MPFSSRGPPVPPVFQFKQVKYQEIVVRRFIFTRHNVKTANYISTRILFPDYILS